MWNHYAHYETYFGVIVAGGVMHTLNLRLAPDDIAFIANHAQDRFLIVDDVLLPLFEQFRAKVDLERVIVVPLTGKPVPARLRRLRSVPAHGDGRLRLSRDGRERAVRHVLHLGHDRASPRAWCTRTARRSCIRWCRRMPDAIGIGGSDVILPVVPMFHANAWGVPYTAAMLGVKMVFPGPHLHPDDLLPLLESEQVTHFLRRADHLAADGADPREQSRASGSSARSCA